MFACVCAQKSVELGADRKLHRALKDQQLQDEIQSLIPSSATDNGNSALVCSFQPGGGVRMDSEDSTLSLAAVDTCVSVFQGTLQNAADLVRKYGSSSNSPAATVGAGTLAELVCRLYIAHGVEMLTVLRGNFSFCLYESKTARVLASSDKSGGVTLFEGRTASGDLIVASSRDYLTTCTDVVQFQPGDYKYGWHAMHRQFDPADFASDNHGRKVQSGGRKLSFEHPHHGLGNGSTARRRSLDHGQTDRPPSGEGRRSHDASSHRSPNPQPSQQRPSAANAGGGLTTSRLARCSNDHSEDLQLPRLSSRRGLRKTSSAGSSQSSGSSSPSLKARSGCSLDPDACPFTPSAATVTPPSSPAPASPKQSRDRGASGSHKAAKRTSPPPRQQAPPSSQSPRSVWVAKGAMAAPLASGALLAAEAPRSLAVA